VVVPVLMWVVVVVVMRWVMRGSLVVFRRGRAALPVGTVSFSAKGSLPGCGLSLQ